MLSFKSPLACKIVKNLFLRLKIIEKEAIEYIFCSIGNHKSGFNIMMAIIQYLVKQDQLHPLSISNYEYYLYNDEPVDLDLRASTLLELFYSALECYNLNEEETQKMIDLLVVGFYGVPIKSKLSDHSKLVDDYREFLDSIFINL